MFVPRYRYYSIPNIDYWWEARSIDVGDCPVCGKAITAGTPVKFFRASKIWPKEVRHADGACYAYEQAMQELQHHQEPVGIPS